MTTAMKVEFIAPFLQAAKQVLESELGAEVSRGELALHRSAYTTQDVTALVGVTGSIEGIVLYGMSEKTARQIVSTIIGRPFVEFDSLAESGIAELGNVITGVASTLLAEAGYPSNLAPPILIRGSGMMISTLDISRLVIPLRTSCGPLEVHVALKAVARK